MKEKKKNNKSTGYLFIIIGVLMIVGKLISGSDSWSTVDLIKIASGVLGIGLGGFMVMKK